MYLKVKQEVNPAKCKSTNEVICICTCSIAENLANRCAARRLPAAALH